MNNLILSQEAQPMPRKEQVNDGQHAAWIAGRVQVLLSHYFQPDNPMEVKEAALDDWVKALISFPKQIIDRACERYLNNQPRRRPTPGDIRSICGARQETKSDSADPRGNKSKLTFEQLELLEDSILPTARKWLNIQGLEDSARQTLEYWGEDAGRAGL